MPSPEPTERKCNMKIIKKSDITFKNGRFIVGDECVGFDYEVGLTINLLERHYQHALWKISAYNAAKLRKAPEPFEFESAFGCKFEIKAETPALDKSVKEALAVMDDMDRKLYANAANAYIETYDIAGLVDWLNADEIAVTFDAIEPKVDAKFIGNPLELDEERLSAILSAIGEATVLPEL